MHGESLAHTDVIKKSQCNILKGDNSLPKIMQSRTMFEMLTPIGDCSPEHDGPVRLDHLKRLFNFQSI